MAAAAAAAAALARLAAAFLLLAAQVACEYGMVHVVSESGGPRGKDYCILYNPQWAHLPHDLSKAIRWCQRPLPQSLLQLRDWTASVLCSPPDLPAKGFSNQIPLVARGNCTFYEKVRLAQGGGARGLLIVSRETLVPPGGNKTQYEEIGIPVALLSYKDMLDIFQSFGRSVRAALYAPNEPMLDYNMVIIFVMAVGTVALGGYWAGSRDVRKRYMKHKRDDGPEKQEDEAVDVTPVMICVFVVMCCSMLVLLYYFYDQLVYVIIGIFCLSSSTGLYSCLSPLVQRLPFGRCRVPDNSLPYFHKRPRVSMLLLALLCLAVSVVWGVFRNEDQWAWILQDALGVAFCLYMLKTIRLPTFKACTLLLLVLFVYDVFFVFITPFLTKSGNSIMVEVATGPSDSATHEKLPMVLKVPRLNASPLALCDRPFSLLGFGDILVPAIATESTCPVEPDCFESFPDRPDCSPLVSPSGGAASLPDGACPCACVSPAMGEGLPDDSLPRVVGRVHRPRQPTQQRRGPVNAPGSTRTTGADLPGVLWGRLGLPTLVPTAAGTPPRPLCQP
ncbi:signal peptide peptidase-like 2B isoform X4 [Panthera pardus]|uniref:Signal peptide peptidase-like 2B n=1 Tax=Panthera pardus TaxID=9691 RepID=A0A9W2V2C1_PANPR|nr:signal peptide peptidase-like 2B isoform X4 [Panthera pardus]